MSDFADRISAIKEIENYLKKINEKISPITILGLSDVSKACIIGTSYENEKRQILLVTYNEIQAQVLHKHLKAISKNALYIPRKDIVTYAYDAQSMDILYHRIESIIKLYNNEAEIVVISIETLMQPILSRKVMQNSILKLMLANEYSLEEIKQKLVSLGYERQDLVEGKGTFSVRGDILDIAISNKIGVRIEFFGDEIDQIRYFDISSQRSTENVNQIRIFPISEEIDKEPKGSILEYLKEDSIVAFDEINKIDLRAKSILKDNELATKDLIERSKSVPYVLKNMYDIVGILEKTAQFQVLYLESQDIIVDRENDIRLEYENIKRIEEIFFEITKQAKENRTYKPRTRHSSEFREAEKINFSDLKVRRLCCS